MGLLDIFKKKNGKSPAKEALAEAEKNFEKGDYRAAIRSLISGFRKDADNQNLYRLAADCFNKLNSTEEKKLFEDALRDFDKPEPFFELGNFYLSTGDYVLAEPFFEKTLRLKPKYEGAQHNLAICYARRFQIKKAVEILSELKSNDFWDQYFLMKCKILDKDIEFVEDALIGLKSFLDTQEDKEEVYIPKLKIMELMECLERYQTIPDIQNHIRDWHFIQYGSAILSYFEDSDEYVAGGRYVASWGSNVSIKGIAMSFRKFAEKLAVPIAKVLSMPDRDSEIIGRLMALELGLNFDFYDSHPDAQNSLIVGADSSCFQDYEALNIIENGQIVFSLNHCWLAASMVSPDIIGLMSQMYYYPWQQGIKMNPETGAVEDKAPDSRSAIEIANEIYTQTAEPENMDKLIAFYSERKEYLKGIGSHTSPNRFNFMIESPVGGSYFN